MSKITPHLWFDKEAKEAGKFYTSLFKNSRVKSISTIHDTPSGDCDLVSIELAGQEFRLISAGPMFKFNPAISFLIACNTKEEVDTLWGELSKSGNVLMPLDKYPFCEKYGWTADRYGLSWHVMFTGADEIKQKITPTLMFVGKQVGRAEEAINFYASVFHNSKVGDIMRYGADKSPDKEGTVEYASFMLEGQQFAAMDSAHQHNFGFNEAISLMVNCESQEQIDYYAGKLSADPQAEVCGWLKDKFGVSWQVYPTVLEKMLSDRDEKKVARVVQAFLKMKRFNIAKLREVYERKDESAA
jgi:predicted 3-demethylubiquinone-9 3-methyltransferase (glyoxalase superfamily)